jgi:hypothetical protein
VVVDQRIPVPRAVPRGASGINTCKACSTPVICDPQAVGFVSLRLRRTATLCVISRQPGMSQRRRNCWVVAPRCITGLGSPGNNPW